MRLPRVFHRMWVNISNPRVCMQGPEIFKDGFSSDGSQFPHTHHRSIRPELRGGNDIRGQEPAHLMSSENKLEVSGEVLLVTSP